MLGDEAEVETNAFYENNSVFVNSYITESTLKKQHNSLEYRAFFLTSDEKELSVFSERINDKWPK